MSEKLNIEVILTADPQETVSQIEAITNAICEQTGQDAAAGVMMLLTAAAKINFAHSMATPKESVLALGESLGHAIVAARHWWGISRKPFDA